MLFKFSCAIVLAAALVALVTANGDDGKGDNGHHGRSDCQLPKEVGPCKARIPRFWYDKSDKKCKEFFYGGCKGNGNNFKDREECVETCIRKPKGP